MATNNDAACDDPLSLVCKLCDKPYQHKDGPLLLPCLHSFCKPCLTEYVKKAPVADNKMACPTCNDRFPQDINQLPINLRLSHLAKTATYEKQAEGGNVKCQKCEGTPKDATTFSCNRCKFLCDKCKSNFERVLEDDDLEFIDLASYEKGEFKVHSPPPKCPMHKKQELALFCDDCETLICLYCSRTEHANHKNSSLEIVAEQKKEQLHQLTDGVDVALGAMDDCLQQTQDTRDKVKVSAEVAANRIDKMCDELVKAVENRRKVLKGKCREIAEGKDDVLSNQMVQVQRLRRNLGFAHLHALDAIKSHAPEEILSVKKPIEARLNRTFETYKRESLELREDDSINTSTEIVDLEEAIGKIGSIPSVPDPSQCCLNGLEIPHIGTGREKKMTVVLKDEAGNPIPRKCPFQYQLRKVGEDPDEYIPPRVTVTHSNNGTATLAFTPDQLGEYELTIMVRNRPIVNPFKIITRQSRDYYSNFRNMQVTYKNVGGQCYGVAVHDNGTVYASDYYASTIKVFKPNGGETQIGSSDNAKGKLSYPYGIALIGDTIYVVSHGNNTVKMYSTDGKFIGGFGGNGNGTGRLSNPWGICTDGKGRVLVANSGNKRIQIFTSQGVFIKSIGCSTNPYDVAVDPEGNIHAALYSNNHIAIYSEDGNLIDTYNLEGKLQYPQAIYIDGEGNRLIGTYNGAVHIADPTGTLIATRQVGMSYAVTMDKNGIIYVAECNNNRVSIYN